MRGRGGEYFPQSKCLITFPWMRGVVVKSKGREASHPFSRWLHSFRDNPCTCENGKWTEFAWMPQAAQRDGKTPFRRGAAHFGRIYTRGPRQASKKFAPSSMATPRKNRELFFEITDCPLSEKEPWKLPMRPFWPWAPGFLRCTFQEQGRQSRWMGCWRTQKYFLEHRKQGDCCSCCCWASPTPREDRGWCWIRRL